MSDVAYVDVHSVTDYLHFKVSSFWETCEVGMGGGGRRMMSYTISGIVYCPVCCNPLTNRESEEF